PPLSTSPTRRSSDLSALGATLLDEAMRWLPEEAAPDGRAAGHAPAGAERLLVVDDNADMRAYLRRLLGARWHVEVAADGQEALRSEEHTSELQSLTN